MFNPSYDIFLSYFRDDSGGWTGLLHRSLGEALPTHRVFKDDEETPAGTPWGPRLERLVRGCRCFLLVITKDWSKPQVRALLADRDNWVRREILAAVASRRRFIPVLVDGAALPHGLPSEIQTVINDHQCFSFSRGTAQWNDEIAALAKQITGAYRRSSREVQLTKLFAPLDRYWETPCVRAAVMGGYVALPVGAGLRDEPVVFAQRCGEEIAEHASGEQTFDTPIALPWQPFAQNPKPELRRQDLLHAIAKSVNLDAGGKVEEDLRHYFRDNQQIQVFFSMVPSSSVHASQRIAEWLAIWREVLARCASERVLVLLFIPKGGPLGRRPHLPAPATEDIERLQRQGLGKVKPEDLDAFVERLDQGGNLSAPQHAAIQKAKRWLFPWPWGRCLRSVKNRLAPILT